MQNGSKQVKGRRMPNWHQVVLQIGRTWIDPGQWGLLYNWGLQAKFISLIIRRYYVLRTYAEPYQTLADEMGVKAEDLKISCSITRWSLNPLRYRYAGHVCPVTGADCMRSPDQGLLLNAHPQHTCAPLNGPFCREQRGLCCR
jgi:hypothetical protein